MSIPAGFSLKVSNFKCFGDEPQGFDDIKAFNVIIGRNNSGKSSLLDLVRLATQTKIKIPRELWNRGQQPQILAAAPIPIEVAKGVFPETTSRGGIPGLSHWEFGQVFVGTRISWQLGGDKRSQFVAIDACSNGKRPLDALPDRGQWELKLAQAMQNPLANKIYRRIGAERNIGPEPDGLLVEAAPAGRILNVESDGRGATNIIQSYLNKSDKPRELVRQELLGRLNEILHPDATFTDIVCQQLDNGHWEIYVEEANKGLIALSQSGSGLKTIILLLVNILLVPREIDKPLAEFVFACEELENNIHPSLLRRLLEYLFGVARNSGAIFFIATHSNVAIDVFSAQDDAQISHVTHDGNEAICRTVTTYLDSKNILDDLDVRASDLLQSNGVVWVEGPSDRTYINRWVDIKSGGQLSEGLHYQCMFYGGRLLAHLSGDDPSDTNEGIAVLRLNRNACIVMDSDKNSAESAINETKERILSEFGEMGGLAWVTDGKEIENYLPAHCVCGAMDISSGAQIDQYDDFVVYLNGIEEGVGDKYARKKPLFAEKIASQIDGEASLAILDLEERTGRLCAAIRRWNNLPEPTMPS